MRCAALLLGAGIGVFATTAAAGSENYYVYADVVDVEPLIERHTVTQPHETCPAERGRSAAQTRSYHRRHGRHHYEDADPDHAYSRRSHGSGVASILGGVIGGLVGSQFGGGGGRKVLTITGAILGASIARRSNEHRHEAYPSHYTPQRCTTVMETREIDEVAGYRVRYLYQGQEFVKRVDTDPGDRIRVQVQVTPLTADPAS